MLIVIAACAAISLASSATVAEAAFPGENGRISFTRVIPNGQTDVYSAEPTGMAEIRITEDGQSDNAAFSPDGMRLAYSSGDDILIADQYGNDAQLVLSTGQGVEEIDWSPDGTELVAALTNCAESDCEYDIYTVGIDGTGLTNLTNSIFSERSPAWSPDGSLIAFDSIVAGERDVYTVQPDGAGLSNLTDDLAAPASEPDFSPDGSRIVFEGSPNSMNPDGSGKSSIFSGARPAWSPDGARTAYGGIVQGPITDATYTGVGRGRDPDWQVRPPEPVPPQRGIEYPRPKGATPLRVPLVPMYFRCGETGRTPNRLHGPPLEHPSCAIPIRTSALTVGTPDSSNGLPAEATGSVHFASILGTPTTPEVEADVRIRVSQTDVRYHDFTTQYADYPGELLLVVNLRTTDFFNAGGGTDGSATVVDFPLRVVVPCAPTAGPEGGTCDLDTTVDAVVPGLVRERERTVWELGQVVLHWEGADGNPNTLDDNAPFVGQGLFVP